MIRPQPRRKPDKLSQTLGVLLILVGLAYVALLAFVLTSVPVPQFELRAGQAKEVWEFLLVVVFMLGFGALLLWIGYTYLRPETERPESVDEKTTMLLPNPNYLLVKYRRVVELIAASGCGLMLAHSMALFKGAIWPSLTALWILTFTPAVISIVVMRILVPFQPDGKRFAT